MAYYLGLDTSNYTTSVALYDDVAGAVYQNKKLLPVKEGAIGLRQSDAVFSHICQMGQLAEDLLRKHPVPLAAVGVSTRPRDEEGSYMPCFLVGETVAQTTAAACGVPLYRFSHQSGHIAAALFSAGQLELRKKTFAAFHFSGGTTEALLVRPNEQHLFSVTRIAQSLDLKAGQAVDRTGALLGLSFPAGKALDTLAAQSEKRYRVKPAFKGMDCSLSGIENKCQRMKQDGEAPCDIARFCIDSILAVAAKMTEQIKAEYGDIPVVYAGGVMSNSILRAALSAAYGGQFAQPEFSSDNAAGVAVLAGLMQMGGGQ